MLRMNLKDKAKEVYDFFEKNDVDKYVLSGLDSIELRQVASLLDRHVVKMNFKIRADGKVGYDSESNKFFTVIESNRCH